MKKKLGESRVAIVGLGLMGGSLAAALNKREACGEVWGVARRQETIDEALQRGFIDQGTCNLARGVKGADVVVLATPVRTIIELIHKLGPLLPSGCLLMDVGSTKREIVEAMEVLPPHVQPLGGHPMCGKETSGLAAAEVDLYEGAMFAITPLSRTSQEASDLAREIVKAVGAQPLVLEAERHDRLVAAISHLPYMVSLSLMMTTEEVAAEDSLVWKLAASGFRDTSRLAVSDVVMMLDVLATNREAVNDILARFRDQLDELEKVLESEEEGRLSRLMEAARRRRKGMFR